MSSWIGTGAFQWEHTRKWHLATSGVEITRAEGALVIPGGVDSLSFFFRRASQDSGTNFTLGVATSPIYFKPLDEVMDTTAADAYLFGLEFGAATALNMDASNGTSPKLFAGRLKPGQPMGSLLFWRMVNEGSAGGVVGDLYVVANHSGVMTQPRILRTVDGVESNAMSLNGRMLK
ncbi:MAG: hypothetical protein Q8P18_19305 [Pseudomonadota bacterium]|nr:hypothetical protein [Pseudomonadota bacterium]